MNVSLDNVPGMGPVKLPPLNTGEFGSGDIPLSLDQIYSYSDYVNIVFKDKNDEEDPMNEESMMDRIQSKGKNRSPERQHTEYAKEERQKFNEWQIARRDFYMEKVKNAKTKEEKQLLKNQFRLEILKKKRALSDKLKNKRLSKSSKNLKN